MMNNGNSTHASECKCFSWSPIVAGAITAIGFTFLLNLFSLAIGLTAFTTTSEGIETLMFGGFLGIGLGLVVSMFGAGWLTGYLGQRHCNKRHLGALYGFLAWCFALIIGILLATHAQQYISFYSHLISGSTDVYQMTNAAGNTVTVAASNMPAKGIVLSSYIVFSLFFLGAFASSFGGHCGMRHAWNRNGTC